MNYTKLTDGKARYVAGRMMDQDGRSDLNPDDLEVVHTTEEQIHEGVPLWIVYDSNDLHAVYLVGYDDQKIIVNP